MRIRGTVKWFNDTKGYGFLRRDDGQSDCFVHHSDIDGEGYHSLQEGERVEFDVIEQPKGPKASNVVKVAAGDTGSGSAEQSEPAATGFDAPAPSEPADSSFDAPAPSEPPATSFETAAPSEPAESGFDTQEPSDTESGGDADSADDSEE